MLHIPPTEILPPNRSKNRERKKTHKKEPTFPKMELYGNKSHENGPKAETDNTERVTTRQKTKRGDTEKSDQTDSPEIPDRGGDIINVSVLSS